MPPELKEELKDEPEKKEVEENDSPEAQAKLQGWVEKDDYHGDAPWRSAEEFLEIGDKFAGVQRERNEKLSEDIKAARRDNLTMQSQMEYLIKHQEEQKQRAIQKEIRGLKAEKRVAVEDQDSAGVDALEREIEELMKEGSTSDAPKKPSTVFLDWQSRNEWYNVDAGLSAVADDIGTTFQDSGRFTSEEALFKAVDRELARRYPGEFDKKEEKPEETNPNKRRPAAVATSRRKSDNSGKRTFDDVPAEDKKAFQIQQEIMGKDNYTQEQFMALYEFDPD